MPRLKMRGALVYIFTFLTESRLAAEEFYSCYFIRLGCRIHKLFRGRGRGLGLRPSLIWWCCLIRVRRFEITVCRNVGQ
jgi:hypothetical protein